MGYGPQELGYDLYDFVSVSTYNWNCTFLGPKCDKPSQHQDSNVTIIIEAV